MFWKSLNLKKKIISYSGNNTNTNFDGIARKGKNNVFIKLKNSLNRDILGLGCCAHIVHNGIQCAADSLPLLILNLSFVKYLGLKH